MITPKIIAAYEQMAEQYNAKIDHKPHNAYYDRPNTLKLVPDVKGLNVLDAACGPGKYAEILIERGASVVGFDLSPSMVAFAKKRNPTGGRFFVHDLTAPLDQFKEETFDLVICALALHYIEDWGPTIREFCRVLKPNGTLVFSIEHPFFEYNYHKTGHYFGVEHVKCTWNGFGQPIEVNSFRRGLGECIAPITNNGFYIDQIVEPRPTAEFEKLDPKYFKALNEFPAFLCIRAVKR
ncbi:MAG: class I SAM-dependent methyltransferase [Bacteroidota bacterium]